jgi:hypothetical protein
MLKNSKVVFISVTLKSWSGRKLLDPTAYISFPYPFLINCSLFNLTPYAVQFQEVKLS